LFPGYLAETAYTPLLVEPESFANNGLVPGCPLVSIQSIVQRHQQLPIALSWCQKVRQFLRSANLDKRSFCHALNIDDRTFPSRYTFSNALPGKTYYWP